MGMTSWEKKNQQNSWLGSGSSYPNINLPKNKLLGCWFPKRIHASHPESPAIGAGNQWNSAHGHWRWLMISKLALNHPEISWQTWKLKLYKTSPLTQPQVFHGKGNALATPLGDLIRDPLSHLAPQRVVPAVNCQLVTFELDLFSSCSVMFHRFSMFFSRFSYTMFCLMLNDQMWNEFTPFRNLRAHLFQDHLGPCVHRSEALQRNNGIEGFCDQDFIANITVSKQSCGRKGQNGYQGRSFGISFRCKSQHPASNSLLTPSTSHPQLDWDWECILDMVLVGRCSSKLWLFWRFGTFGCPYHQLWASWSLFHSSSTPATSGTRPSHWGFWGHSLAVYSRLSLWQSPAVQNPRGHWLHQNWQDPNERRRRKHPLPFHSRHPWQDVVPTSLRHDLHQHFYLLGEVALPKA